MMTLWNSTLLLCSIYSRRDTIVGGPVKKAKEERLWWRICITRLPPWSATLWRIVSRSSGGEVEEWRIEMIGRGRHLQHAVSKTNSGKEEFLNFNESLTLYSLPAKALVASSEALFDVSPSVETSTDFNLPCSATINLAVNSISWILLSLCPILDLPGTTRLVAGEFVV